MSSSTQVVDRIHDWVLRTFPLARQYDLDVDASLLESGVIDSMGTLEVVQFLEEEFGIEVTDDEMVADHFESVRSISQLVESKNHRN